MGKTASYTYDKTGILTAYQDYAGTITAYVYDGMGRMIRKTTGEDVTAYTYDSKGLLTEVKDKSGVTVFGYDNCNRLEQVTDTRGSQMTYTYDSAGRRKTFDNGYGKTAYEYDLLDRITRVIDRNGQATVYEYDALGNRSAVRYPNGSVMTYTYDACQRLREECITGADGILLAKYTYGLGKAGERLSVTEVNSGRETTTAYEYDKLNRLVKETIQHKDSSLTNTYVYDRNGNRTEKHTEIKGDITDLAAVASGEVQLTEGKTVYTYNALNQLVTEQCGNGVTGYSYDDNGNLIKQTGNRMADYTYDKENHLLRATIQKGNAVTTESYTYDYAGNRASRTINETDTLYYVNDISGSLTRVTAETDGNGTEKAYFSYGEDLLSMESAGKVCYYLYDGHGSVRLLTNGAGRITDRYAYDAYGSLLQKEGDTENEFLYTGEQYHAGTGLYYLRARYMNPSTGTFISMDSYPGNCYDPASLHKYLYANANPVMYTDPSGYFSLMETAIAQNIRTVLAKPIAQKLLKNVMNAVIGGTISAIDSALGGNDLQQILKDAAKGAFAGVFIGYVISAMVCYATVYPIVYCLLQISPKILLSMGGIGVWVSLKDGHPAQAVFRGILGLFAYWQMGKVLDGIEFVGAKGGTEGGSYASLDDGLNFSNKALEHMGESGRQVPMQTLQDAIRSGEAMPDPRGSSATMYYTTMYKNGKMYNLEVLYDEVTNTVYHFEYARRAMGNLPAIPK